MSKRQSFDREELRLLYEVTVTDLSYFKTQQWAVTNYTLLIQGAVVGISQLLTQLQQSDRFLLSLLSALGAAAGVTVLWKLQRSIGVRQSRLHATREEFSDEFKAAWAAETKGPEYVHSIYLLYATVAISALLVGWLVLCRL